MRRRNSDEWGSGECGGDLWVGGGGGGRGDGEGWDGSDVEREWMGV